MGVDGSIPTDLLAGITVPTLVMSGSKSASFMLETAASVNKAIANSTLKSASLMFDTWVGVKDPTANGGTFRVTSTRGAKATFKFSGTGVTWVTRKGTDQGIASVTIDGKVRGSIDLYAGSVQSFSQSYAGLAKGRHTIVVTVTGSKSTQSSGAGVAVDAFVVGPTTIDDTSPGISYEGWRGANSTSASGGTYRVTTTRNATVTLNFTGTGVDWVTATGPADGLAQVTIDGVKQATVDLFTAQVAWQVSKSYAGLAPGPHTIVITALGTKDATSTGSNVIVDALVAH